MARPVTARRRTPTRGRAWRKAWLAAFREQKTVTGACRAAGVGRATVYDARAADEEFAQAWDEVEAELVEAMEAEMYRRAVEGVERPIYQGGKLVGHVREFSDSLLMFGLRARRPGVYRENVLVEHSGPGGGPIELAVPVDAAARSARAAQLISEADNVIELEEHAGNGNGSAGARG